MPWAQAMLGLMWRRKAPLSPRLPHSTTPHFKWLFRIIYNHGAHTLRLTSDPDGTLPGDLIVVLLAVGAKLREHTSAVPWRDGKRRPGVASVTALTRWSPPHLLQCALPTPAESTSAALTQRSEELQHSGVSPGNCDLKDKQTQKMPSETSQEPSQRCGSFGRDTVTSPFIDTQASLCPGSFPHSSSQPQ